MSIYNLGSINIDTFYDLPHLPQAGETLAANALRTGLGGKGANISVAAARAAAHVRHIGLVSREALWTKMRLMEYGVDTTYIEALDKPQGHASIYVDEQGENSIVIYAGTNALITEKHYGAALSDALAGDIFVTQNENNASAEAAAMAKVLGLRVAYVAAPFSVAAFITIRPHIDILILNGVEAAQLQTALGQELPELGIATVIVTKGAEGCDYWSRTEGKAHCPALKVTPIDTTGAGDTFAGYVLAGLDQGHNITQAIAQASKAAALMVTRPGTADVIPDLKDVQDWVLDEN